LDLVFVDPSFTGCVLFGFCVLFFAELVFAGKVTALVFAFPRGFDVGHSELDGELLSGVVGELGFSRNSCWSLQKNDKNFILASFHWTLRFGTLKIPMCRAFVIIFDWHLIPFLIAHQALHYHNHIYY